MEPGKNLDYVAHGSPQHAALIGLLVDKNHSTGYRLADMTAYGPQASPAYLEEVLRQKVAVLQGGAPALPQSKDPRKPNYAPPLWVPDPEVMQP